MTTIDLNADLGEGFGRWELGDDAGMLDIVTSANIACGFHAGDPERIRATAAAATERGVSIGAHVAYRDLAGFGRRYVDASSSELSADVIYQLGALQALATASGGVVRYVKPHGALYNTIASDRRHADAVIDALLAAAPHLPLVVLAGSPLSGWAQDAGLRAVPEAFADRAYEPDGMLVSRHSPGAVLHDAAEVADRMLELVETGGLTAIDGSHVEIAAESVCVHGDSAGAVDMARSVRERLESAGVELRAFTADVP